MTNARGLNMKRAGKVALVTLLLLATATVALASEGGGGHGHADSGVILKDFIFRCLNFAVMVAILGYFITKPIRQGLAGRRESVEKELNEARTAREEAEAKFAEYDRKLSDAAAEIDEIYEAIRREGEMERERIIANAQEMAEKIKQEAGKSAANEIKKAQVELRREAARMAIEIAEGLVKENFTDQDHARLVDEYMQKVGELH